MLELDGRNRMQPSASVIPHRTRSRLAGLIAAAVACAAAMLMAAPALAQSSADLESFTATGDVDQELARVKSRLIAEAMALGLREEEADGGEGRRSAAEKYEVEPLFERPHPWVKQLGPDHVLPMLKLIASGNLTGDEYRDLYVKWHFIWLLRKAHEEDREATARILLEVLKTSPDDIDIKRRREEWDEPEENARKVQQAVQKAKNGMLEPTAFNRGIVKTGVPPFRKTVFPPKSLELMKPAQRKAYEKYTTQREELARIRREAKQKYPFKEMTDPSAIRFNRLLDRMSGVLRTFRGDVVYGVLVSGYEPALTVAVNAIERHAQAKRLIAFDLSVYFYKALFSGELARYDDAALQRAGAQLQRIAQQTDQWTVYERKRIGRNQFTKVNANFGDFIFHLVLSLQNGEVHYVAPLIDEDIALPDEEQPELDEDGNPIDPDDDFVGIDDLVDE